MAEQTFNSQKAAAEESGTRAIHGIRGNNHRLWGICFGIFFVFWLLWSYGGKLFDDSTETPTPAAMTTQVPAPTAQATTQPQVVNAPDAVTVTVAQGGIQPLPRFTIGQSNIVIWPTNGTCVETLDERQEPVAQICDGASSTVSSQTLPRYLRGIADHTVQVDVYICPASHPKMAADQRRKCTR